MLAGGKSLRVSQSLSGSGSQSGTSLGCGLVMCIWVTSLQSGALIHVVRSHLTPPTLHGDCCQKNSRLWLSHPLISAANSSCILFWTVPNYCLPLPFYHLYHNHKLDVGKKHQMWTTTFSRYVMWNYLPDIPEAI